MTSLSKDLVNRCRQILLKCDEFDSDATLKTVFIVTELQPFQKSLPEANSSKDRVDKLIKLLMQKEDVEPGYSALLCFVEALHDKYASLEDNLCKELKRLCFDIDCANFLKRIPANIGRINDFPDNLVEVAQCLLRCNHMREKQLIEEVLKLLPMEITQHIPKNYEHIFYFKDMLHIVQICSSYPDGLEKLAYALYPKEGDSPEWQALDTLLHRIGKKTVTYTRLRQLQAILEGITWSDKILSKAYRVSIPDGWIELSTDSSIDLLPSILENLVVAPPQSDGTFPIMVFAQYLAYHAQKYQEVSIHNALIVWIRERTQELGLSATQVSILHDKVSTYCLPAAYHLLIALDPERENSFCMQAWLLDSEGNTISNAGIEVEHESVSLEQVPVELGSLLVACGSYLADEINKLIIEFFLPGELLCYPIDHWPIDTGMGSVKLGIQHKVVVRSLERLRNPILRPQWKSKGKELQKLQDGGNTLTNHQRSVWICDEDQYGTYESLYAALHGSPIVCLALTFAPLDSLISLSHILKAPIGAGIPIVLWPRKLTDTPTTAYNLFTSFLSPQTLFEIPHRVWEHRLAAGKSRDEHHQGHHLTLLWDNPNILPPTEDKEKVKFSMPSTRRGA
jgi:vWA-MoxR associated protein C-terminal domain/Effector-associated domain 2